MACGTSSFCPGGPQVTPLTTQCPDGLTTQTNTATSLTACVRSCAAGTYAPTPTAPCEVRARSRDGEGRGKGERGSKERTRERGSWTLSQPHTHTHRLHPRLCFSFPSRPRPPLFLSLSLNQQNQQSCGTNFYCPGGFQDEGPLRDPCPQSPPPPYTTLVTNASTVGQCVISCPAGQFATTPAGPCIACGAGYTCPGGPQATPQRTPCATGTNTCSTTAKVCYDFQTDAANCGACNLVCPLGSVCSGGACVCASDGVPVASATPVKCGKTIEAKQNVVTYEYSVTPGEKRGRERLGRWPQCARALRGNPPSLTVLSPSLISLALFTHTNKQTTSKQSPGATYAAVYDSQSIPDRYVLRWVLSVFRGVARDIERERG